MPFRAFPRRPFIALAALLAVSLPGLALAQAKLKVAAIYTVPFEQQWVSRIHKALQGCRGPRRDRVQGQRERQQCRLRTRDARVRQRWEPAHRRRGLRGRGQPRARSPRIFPRPPSCSAPRASRRRPTSAWFDNYIQEPAYLSGMIAGGMTKSNQIGMVGGFPIPEVNRLMNAFMAGAREVNPKGQLHGQLHQQLVRSAQGQGGRVRDGRQRRRHPLCRALRRVGRGQGEGQAGDRQRDQHAGHTTPTPWWPPRCGTWSRPSIGRSSW